MEVIQQTNKQQWSFTKTENITQFKVRHFQYVKRPMQGGIRPTIQMKGPLCG